MSGYSQFYHHYFQREKGKMTMRKSLKNAKVNPPLQYHPESSGSSIDEDTRVGREVLKGNKGMFDCDIVGVVLMLAGYSSRFDL